MVAIEIAHRDQVDLAEEELRIDTQKFVRSAWKSNAQLTIAPVIKDTPFADSDVRCLLKNKEATQINDGDFKQGKMPVRVRIINFGGDIIVCASPYNESEGRDFLLRVKPFTVSYDR